MTLALWTLGRKGPEAKNRKRLRSPDTLLGSNWTRASGPEPFALFYKVEPWMGARDRGVAALRVVPKPISLRKLACAGVSYLAFFAAGWLSAFVWLLLQE